MRKVSILVAVCFSLIVGTILSSEQGPALEGEFRRIVADGGYVYLFEYVDWDTLYVNVLDATDPAHPALLTRAQFPYLFHFYDETAVFTDVSDPDNPTVHFVLVASPHYVVQGDYIYVISSSGEMRILDVSDPENVQTVAEITIPEGPNTPWEWPGSFNILDVMDEHAYVTIRKCQFRACYFALLVVDISDWNSPVVTAELPFSVDVYPLTYGALAISGNTAYLHHGGPISANLNKEVTVLDVSEPAVPEVVAQYEIPGGVGKLEASGNFIYFVTTSVPPLEFEAGVPDTLKVMDVATPTSPVELGSYRVPGWDMSRREPEKREWQGQIALVGDYIYTLDRQMVHVLDVSDPSAIAEAGRYPRMWTVSLPIVRR